MPLGVGGPLPRGSVAGVRDKLEERSAGEVPRFLLEGCAFDPLLDDPGLLARLMNATRRGLIKLLVTDLTHQDLTAIRDDQRRADLLRVLRELSPETVGLPAVLVRDAVKRARPLYPGTIYPVGEETGALLERLGVSHRADARQAVAAQWADACLVTSDVALIRRATSEGIRAQTTEQFAAEFIGMLTRSEQPNDR